MNRPSAGRKPRLPGGLSLPPFGIHQLLAAVVVCVALWTVAVAWLAVQAGEHWIATWQQDVRFHVYVDARQADAVQPLISRLRQLDGVAAVRLVDETAKLSWLQAWLGHATMALNELAAELPQAIEIVPEADAPEFLFADIRDEARRFGAEVNEEEVQLARAQQWLGRIKMLVGFAAAILALAMAVIISNTLRMTLLARADEVHLMRLLGAHEWFVRLPFILEGMLLGAAAALAAWALLWPLIFGLEHWLGPALRAAAGVDVLMLLLFAGAAVGCLGAVIATASIEDELTPD